MREPDYRALALLEARLGRRPRYQPCRVRVRGWALEVPDAASFLTSYRENFVERAYAFPWSGPPPRILDLGANVGVSVLFFKSCHPQAEIVAVEADPAVFHYLERNVRGNGITGVDLVPRAAWHTGGRVAFHSEGGDAGRAIAPAAGSTADAAVVGENLIGVEALDVPALLAARTFDFIKMDIEGAEEMVVPACRAGLGRARYVAIEYHSTAGRPQALAEILQALGDCGFRVHVHGISTSPAPFVEVRTHSGFDLQIHLFGWKA